MELNLRTADPDFRVDDRSPLDLLAAARKLQYWDDTTLEVAEYLLNAWTLDACINGTEQSIADLETTLHALLERLPNSRQVPLALKRRWEGYQSLLAGKMLLLED